MLQAREESIAKIECVSEESIGVWIVQDSIHKHLFEELLIQNSPKVRKIESQLSKHELVACVRQLTIISLVKSLKHGMFY